MTTTCWICLAVLFAVVAIIAKFLLSSKRTVELRKTDWKHDVVYLYQFPRSKTIPNMSPFCLKVETFLKVNKIPYEVCPLLMGRSRYGLLPFVELNGEQIADSQIIVDRLTKYFNVKPLSSSKNEAIARVIERTADIHTFLVAYKFKVVENTDDIFLATLRDLGCPGVLLPIVTPVIAFLMKRKAANRIAAAVGELDREEFKEMLKKDYDAYRDLLGSQKFLFGDEISSADCTLFGQLATLLYIPMSSYAKDILKEKYPTLVEYCDRIRDNVYGDEFESQ
ncbi:hypothetical protein KIN20_034233 [Parelaphostrongylus tenuis]|uniref:GST C-terminal domain-containing protein n=1 Tax=Parelaphostrongylus tenuis TaxID=148309 RepID=A0AAD5WIV8_PARTN|nr:hypothetical protein KIN20_034233 [Parelaphostrongylus tenuis]